MGHLWEYLLVLPQNAQKSLDCKLSHIISFTFQQNSLTLICLVTVGVEVGTVVGVEVGTFVGVEVGTFVGVEVGTFVGVLVGTFVGVLVGTASKRTERHSRT